MGTRATVKFFEHYGPESVCICSVYHQHNGDLAWVGYDLAYLLQNRKIINGFGLDMDMSQYANGLGCLAAQYVAKVKTTIGGVYMTSPDNTQNYDYRIEPKLVEDKQVLHITVHHFETLLFQGGVTDFLRACVRARDGIDYSDKGVDLK